MATEIFTDVCLQLSKDGRTFLSLRDLFVTNEFNVSVYDLLKKNFPSIQFVERTADACVLISVPGPLRVIAATDGTNWVVPENQPPMPLSDQARVLDFETAAEPQQPQPTTRLLDFPDE